MLFCLTDNNTCVLHDLLVCEIGLGSGSQLHVGKVLVSYNASLKTVPLIK